MNFEPRRPRALGLLGTLALFSACVSPPASKENLRARVDALEAAIEAVDASQQSMTTDVIPQVVAEQLQGVATESWVEEQGFVTLTPSVTFSVSDADELLVALDSIRAAIPDPKATLRIELADGTYEMTGPIPLDFAWGDRVRIVGVNGSGAVRLRFVDSDGLVMTEGGTVGLLDGVTLEGAAYGTGVHAAVRVESGSRMALGGDVVIQSFSGVGLLAERGGVIVAPDVSVSGTLHGVQALSGAEVFAADAFISGTTSHAVVAHGGARVDVVGAEVSGSGGHGLAISGGSWCDASGAVVTYSATNGIYVSQASAVEMSGVNVNNSTLNGVLVEGHSWVDLRGAQLLANTLDGVQCRSVSFCDVEDAQIDANQRYGAWQEMPSVIGGTITFGGNTMGNTEVTCPPVYPAGPGTCF